MHGHDYDCTFFILFVLKMPDNLSEQGAILVAQLLLRLCHVQVVKKDDLAANLVLRRSCNERDANLRTASGTEKGSAERMALERVQSYNMFRVKSEKEKNQGSTITTALPQSCQRILAKKLRAKLRWRFNNCVVELPITKSAKLRR